MGGLGRRVRGGAVLRCGTGGYLRLPGMSTKCLDHKPRNSPGVAVRDVALTVALPARNDSLSAPFEDLQADEACACFFPCRPQLSGWPRRSLRQLRRPTPQQQLQPNRPPAQWQRLPAAQRPASPQPHHCSRGRCRRSAPPVAPPSCSHWRRRRGWRRGLFRRLLAAAAARCLERRPRQRPGQRRLSLPPLPSRWRQRRSRRVHQPTL